MGGINVKITMIQRLLQIVAPDLCYFCGKIGYPFCSYCKYDITHESVSVCFWCDKPDIRGVCSRHMQYIEGVSIGAWYEDGVKAALEALKFKNDRFCANALAELIHMRLPYLPADTVIVPVPTLARNVRSRGYDQALLLAKAVGRLQQLPVRRYIQRVRKYTQHDTQSRQQREAQVRDTFRVHFPTGVLVPQTVLIIDDIITTGATVQEIARVLKDSGVQRVFVGAVAHPR